MKTACTNQQVYLLSAHMQMREDASRWVVGVDKHAKYLCWCAGHKMAGCGRCSQGLAIKLVN